MTHLEILIMPRAIHFVAPISASKATQSDSWPIHPNLLFCGICLLAGVIAILTDTPSIWN